MNIIDVNQMELKKISRLEVIDSKGRSYSNWNCKHLDLSLQDNKRTLKIFVEEKKKEKK